MRMFRKGTSSTIQKDKNWIETVDCVFIEYAKIIKSINF